MEKARSGQKIENLDESEYLSVDEVAEKRRVWTTNAASLQATVDATELATEALQVGRENGGVFRYVEKYSHSEALTRLEEEEQGDGTQLDAATTAGN